MTDNASGASFITDFLTCSSTILVSFVVMPSIFSHGIAALAIGKIPSSGLYTWKVLALGVFCSIVPDADTVAFLVGIPYESMWGHRGITHSVTFAVFLGLVVMCLSFRETRPFGKEWNLLWFYFFLATVSHPVLDAMTNGGLGVAFWAPFDNSRYFFSWRPIKVSPIGAKAFFSSRGIAVFKSEFLWVWLPSLIVILVGLFRRK